MIANRFVAVKDRLILVKSQGTKLAWHGFSWLKSATPIIAVAWLALLAQYDLIFLCGLAFYALLSAVYSTPEESYKEISRTAFNRAKNNHLAVTMYFGVAFVLLLVATVSQFNQPPTSSMFFQPFIWIEAVAAITGLATFLAGLFYLQLMKRRGFDKITMPRLILWLVGWLVGLGVAVSLALAFSIFPTGV